MAKAKVRKKKPVSRPSMTDPTPMIRVLRDVEAVLKEWFLERDPEVDNRYGVPIDVTIDRIPKWAWSEPIIPRSTLENDFIPVFWGKVFDDVYLIMVEDMVKRIFENRPDKFLVTSKLRQSGETIEDFILAYIYKHTHLELEYEGVFEKSGIKIAEGV